MAHVAERQDQFVVEYERVSRERAAAQPAWLRETRAAALTRFAELGFPSTRDEEFRFTNVSPIAETAFRLAPAVPAAAHDLIDRVSIPGAHRLVVLNGRYDAQLSDDAAPMSGLTVGGLAEAMASRNGDLQRLLNGVASIHDRAFAALNTAFLFDGILIDVAPGAVVERPLQVIFATAGVDAQHASARLMVHPRLLAVVGANAQARIVETFVGPADEKYFTNAVSEYHVGDGALVDHYKDQREGASAYHVGLQALRCARSSTFVSQNIVLGGQIVRNDIVAVLDGEGVDCTLNGLYLSDGTRLVDNHTTIDHAKPHCGSHELYKGILAGRSRAVFNGKIIVRQDAQKTDAKQTNRALLLSDNAQINTKPQLEIFADDVKCTHGAAVGQLDEEALFYLRARGLTAVQARDLLIHAFAGDILNRIKIEPLRAQLETELFSRLQQDGVM
jgi:Fe-S cluster assembly protein SufD